jgi:hypothetical protein
MKLENPRLSYFAALSMYRFVAGSIRMHKVFDFMEAIINRTKHNVQGKCADVVKTLFCYTFIVIACTL